MFEKTNELKKKKRQDIRHSLFYNSVCGKVTNYFCLKLQMQFILAEFFFLLFFITVAFLLQARSSSILQCDYLFHIHI